MGKTLGRPDCRCCRRRVQPMRVKPTYHSQSAPGYIDHLKITGGMGTSRQESTVDTVGNH